MRRISTILMLSGVLAVAAAVPAFALNLGDTAPEISVKDIRFLPHGWKDFGPRKAYLFAFTALTDPASQALLKDLAGYRNAQESTAIEMVMVSTGTEDSIRAIAADAVRLNTRLTVVKDRDGAAAAAFGITSTPSVVVFDAGRRLVYRGGLPGARAAADALAQDKPASPKIEDAAGRAIVLRATPAPSGPVTYAEHIAPILNQHCVECHRAERATPFTLTSYEDAAAKANMIKEVVLEERMPPWYASPEHQEFINARTLSQEEKDTVAQWVQSGKLPGDLSKAPALPELPKTDWEIGEPDLVLQIPEVSDIPATGFIPYKYPTLQYKFPEDTWIHGLQILPTNKAVVHHANIAYSVIGAEYKEGPQFLTGYVPGGRPAILGGPMAMLIPKNAVLTLQIHYVTTGKPETEQMKVGIRYAKTDVHKRVYYQRIRPEDSAIKIAPNDPFWRVSADWTFDRNATAIALFTHMHVRGRDMEFLADYPDGKKESMLLVPNYSFDWQMPYLYAPGSKQIPKGTKITTVSHYDNSSFNSYNPDPSVTVPYGDQTIHEMNDAYIFFLDNDETLNVKVDPKTGQAVGGSLASAK